MEIKEILNKEDWNYFLNEQSEKTFLQSWNWGEFNLQMKSKIWHFGVYLDGGILAVMLVIKIPARRGTFLFIPHGPVFRDHFSARAKEEAMSLIVGQLKKLSKKEKAIFIRIAPIAIRNQENDTIFKTAGFRKSPIHMHPEVTWELDITKPEAELLREMRKTTRYLIKKGQENTDIEITKSTKVDDLKLFWPVYQETARRQKFVVFSESYIEKEFNTFVKDKEIILLLGKYKGEVVSGAIFVFWQNRCFYHHSGSNQKFSKMPVSYVLMWEAIREAKARGCASFNFWGIAPDIVEDTDVKKSVHPWAGLSLFKMGFGGQRKEYTATQDYIISAKYWLNYIIETIRKRKRNL
jgi:lipid II:glycine glycyltransferase (peptidoglycan interpeptide bridge formation enzyme)